MSTILLSIFKKAVFSPNQKVGTVLYFGDWLECLASNNTSMFSHLLRCHMPCSQEKAPLYTLERMGEKAKAIQQVLQ